MNRLTIFWGEKNSPNLHWQLSSPEQTGNVAKAIHALDSHEILKADLACLAEIANNNIVELILSSSDIHYAEVKIPSKAQRHLRKVIPYLLEEEFAEPIDQIFIATGGITNNGKIAARGINLDYLKSLLKAFELAEIKLDKVVVDLDLLQQPESGYLVVLLNDTILVSQQDEVSWCCHKDDFSWLVQKQITQQNEDELPVAIPMIILSDNSDNCQLFSNNLPAGQFAPRVEMVGSVLEELCKSEKNVINLLQAEFAKKEDNSPLKGMLKKVAMVAAILFFSQVVYLASQRMVLEQQKTLLSKQKTALWKQAFPTRKVPANQDKALRSYMKTIGSSVGENSFLSMLKSVSENITDLEKIYPTNISYESARNEIRIDLIAEDLSTLNQYRDDLKKHGHKVEMSSATQRNDGYSSRLIIRR